MDVPKAKPCTSKKNKTGSWKHQHPVIDMSKCIKCNTCVRFCPEGCINMTEDGAVVDLDYCKGCGICAKECPVKCIKMELEK